MRVETVFQRLLGSQKCRVRSVEARAEEVVFEVEPRWRRPRCGGCGRRGVAGYDRKGKRHWRHLWMGGLRCFLAYAPRRVSCPRCGVVVEEVPWARRQSGFTRAFESLVVLVGQEMSQKAVAETLGIDGWTVSRIEERVAEELRDPKGLDRRIGIDEVSSRKGQNYLTLVVDLDEREVVWAGPGRNEEALEAFFAVLGPKRAKRLRCVSLDGGRPYRNVVERRAPQATIVSDPFPVIANLNKAVDMVRREEWRRLRGEEGDASSIKNLRWVLLKNRENLTKPQGEKLADLPRTNYRLYRCVLLKESFRQIYTYRSHGWALRHFRRWYAWAVRSRLRPIIRFARSAKQSLTSILEYLMLGISNGVVEGINAKIGLLKRRAYGFARIESLIGKIYLACGGLPLPESPLL